MHVCVLGQLSLLKRYYTWNTATWYNATWWVLRLGHRFHYAAELIGTEGTRLKLYGVNLGRTRDTGRG